MQRVESAFHPRHGSRLRSCALVALLALCATAAGAGEWTHWRGPHQTGVSPETGLIDSWSKDGNNLIWRDDFVGRSTPIVVDGRVCAIGRVGEDITRQETVVCWDAGTGERLWERRFNIVSTAVPWNRVGWASMAADPVTGFIYAQAVDGRFVALNEKGETEWEWLLGEEVGRFSGYGGRTNTPVVDENLVIAHVINSGWGKDFGPAGDRYFGFDKVTGAVVWVSDRNDSLKDLNTYSAPVIAEIGGQRLMIAGGADGWIRAVQARTGKDVWKFQLSKRGINASVVVDGDLVIAGHSEENLDEGTMGRVVAIDGTGTGDVTQTHEKWRVNELSAGYASMMVHEGIVYATDNSANLVALDVKTGQQKWMHNFGTVGKGSPVWADGKIYVTEVNGNFHIIKPGAEGAEGIDDEHLEMPYGRYAEVYASPAIAYGRIYFSTEEGMYCLGDKSKEFKVDRGDFQWEAEKAPEGAKPAHLQVIPAVVSAKAANSRVEFKLKLYDAQGRFIRDAKNDEAEWTAKGVPVRWEDGFMYFDHEKFSGTRGGTLTATIGDLNGVSHLRTTGPLPFTEDFSNVEDGKVPSGWMGIGPKGQVVTLEDGNKVLELHKARGAPRARPNMGVASMTNYIVQADVMGTQKGRRRSDVGLRNNNYTFDMQGNHQRLQIRSWDSELRMMKQTDFAWEPDIWYTMKLAVEYKFNDKKEPNLAIVQGKVWKRGEDEPAEWTFTAEDPLPILNGSPGLYGYVPVNSYYDNVKVEVNAHEGHEH